MENVQADYRTRGDLLLSTYSNSDGKIQAAVTCGAGARFNAHLSLKELADLRQFIVTAKEKLDAVRKE